MKSNKILNINIVGEGKQLRDLLEKSQLTPQDLSKAFNLKENSTNKYLNSLQIDNKKFIKRIENFYEKKFHEIIEPVERQVNNYILDIKKNIRLYTYKDDSKVMNIQYENALKYSDEYHRILAKGNLALYRFNRSYMYESEKLLNEVIRESLEEGLTDLALYYTVQLSYIYLYVDKNKSLEIMDNAYKLINFKTPADVLYSYHYFYGVLFLQKEKYRQARLSFEKSNEYATINEHKAKVLLMIALTYYYEKKYRSALKWNEEAMKLAESNNELKSNILNNIANIYIEKGNRDLAENYLKQSLEFFDEISYVKRKLSIYCTYLQIKGREDLLSDLMDIMSVYENQMTIENIPYMAECIKTVFLRLVDYKDILTIRDLLGYLKKIILEKRNNKLYNEFKFIIADIYMYLDEI